MESKPLFAVRRESLSHLARVGLLVALAAGAATAGCATMFLNGGRLVDRNFRPQRILVAYQQEGAVPASTRYYLVGTARGEAMLEVGVDGSGTLIENHWRDGQGADHFAVWIGSSHAYEFAVPADRRQPAVKYAFPAGSYSIQKQGKVSRPVPLVPIPAAARLWPLGQQPRATVAPAQAVAVAAPTPSGAIPIGPAPSAPVPVPVADMAGPASGVAPAPAVTPVPAVEESRLLAGTATAPQPGPSLPTGTTEAPAEIPVAQPAVPPPLPPSPAIAAPSALPTYAPEYPPSTIDAQVSSRGSSSRSGMLLMQTVGVFSHQGDAVENMGPGLRLGTFFGGYLNDQFSLSAEVNFDLLNFDDRSVLVGQGEESELTSTGRDFSLSVSPFFHLPAGNLHLALGAKLGYWWGWWSDELDGKPSATGTLRGLLWGGNIGLLFPVGLMEAGGLVSLQRNGVSKGCMTFVGYEESCKTEGFESDTTVSLSFSVIW